MLFFNDDGLRSVHIRQINSLRIFFGRGSKRVRRSTVHFLESLGKVGEALKTTFLGNLKQFFISLCHDLDRFLQTDLVHIVVEIGTNFFLKLREKYIRIQVD